MNVEHDQPTLFHRVHARHGSILLVALALAGTASAGLALTWRAAKAERRALDALESEVAQRRFAQEQLAVALEELDELYADLGEWWLANADGLTSLQRQCLTKALPRYERFAEAQGDAPDVRRATATAIHRVGQIRMALGRPGDAEGPFEQAVAIRRQLADFPPHHPADRLALAESLRARGAVLSTLRLKTAAEQLDREAADLADSLVAENPGEPLYLGVLIECLNDLSQRQEDLARNDEAETTHQRALSLARSLAASNPTAPRHRELLARLLSREGARAGVRGECDDAEAALRQTIGILKDLQIDAPSRIDYRARHAAALGDLAVALSKAKRPRDADPVLRRSVAMHDELAEEHPDVLLYRRRSAAAWHNLGVLHDRLGRAADAEAAWRHSIKLYEDLLRDFPDDQESRADLAATAALLASKLDSVDQSAKALEYRVMQADAARSLVDLAPENVNRRLALANAWIDIGGSLMGVGRTDEALGYLRNGLAAYEPVSGQRSLNMQGLSYLACGLTNLSQCLKLHRDGLEEAESALRRAADFHRRLANQRPDDLDFQRALGEDLVRLGELRRLQGKSAEAVDLCERALAFQRSNLADNPSDLAVRQAFREAHYELAKAKRALGDRAGASETAESLIRDMPDDPQALAMAVGFLENRAVAKAAVDKAADLGARNASIQNLLAYVLATTSHPGLRDPSRAVELARRATGFSPLNGAYESTLGLALFRSGQYDEAVVRLERAECLPGRLEGLDALALTLAHTQKGDLSTARRHYEHAMKWAEIHSLIDQEVFEDLRAEAEAALNDETS
ncbi:tetratricopeptide repeat protein [Paludisphaera rhizosphaerae]|uniref:tetratricopeptide repeat protein n=1 Tax=Paludisphaera rhizosphaerae TaxID=2711216 RepID=UPI0013EA421C|nr:tetratricopeptide repeat protein [Paludisphaera rhizosphaerae]